MRDVYVFDYQTKNGKTLYGFRFEMASIDGKRKWCKKKGFKNKALAKEAGREAFDEYYSNGSVAKYEDMSYSDFLDLWLEKDVAPFLKETTVTVYKKKIENQIKPHIGKYFLKRINRDIIQSFIMELFNSGLSKNSITTVRGIITKSFNYAVDNRLIKESPAVRIKVPCNVEPEKETNEQPHIYVPREKMQEILRRFPEGSSAHIPLRIGYECGLRIGEVFRLVWEDIDFDNKTLSVRRQVQWHADGERDAREKKRSNGTSDCGEGYWYFVAPKYQSDRTIALSDDLIELFKREKLRQEKAKPYYDEYYFRYYADKNFLDGNFGKRKIFKAIISQNKSSYPVNFLCVRKSGEYIQSRIMQYTNKVIRETIIDDFDFHSLRHTHATDLLENNISYKYIQERLGHKSLDITLNVYGHLSDARRNSENDKLTRLYGNEFLLETTSKL